MGIYHFNLSPRGQVAALTTCESEDGAQRQIALAATTERGDVKSLAERQESIADIVLQADFVSARELARIFDVSLMTIHRDLEELASRGVLRRVRGGATPLPSSLFESNVRFRMTESLPAKQAIARYALTLIEPGQAIMLDDSTTALALARLIPTLDMPLTVITNFLALMRELSDVRNVRLIVVGGEYFPSHDSFTGLGCAVMLKALRADHLFLSTTAVTGGATFQPEPEVAMVKQAMMASATRTTLLVDSAKMGRVALHLLAPLRDFDLIIVDDGITANHLRQLRESGGEVVVAPREGR